MTPSNPLAVGAHLSPCAAPLRPRFKARLVTARPQSAARTALSVQTVVGEHSILTMTDRINQTDSVSELLDPLRLDGQKLTPRRLLVYRKKNKAIFICKPKA